MRTHGALTGAVAAGAGGVDGAILMAGAAGAATAGVTAEVGKLTATGAGIEAPGVTVIGAEGFPGVRLITSEVAPPAPVTVGDKPLGPPILNCGMPGMFGIPVGASTLGFGGPSTSLVGNLAAIHCVRVSP